jgi:hypothetical protein
MGQDCRGEPLEKVRQRLLARNCDSPRVYGTTTDAPNRCRRDQLWRDKLGAIISRPVASRIRGSPCLELSSSAVLRRCAAPSSPTDNTSDPFFLPRRLAPRLCVPPAERSFGGSPILRLPPMTSLSRGALYMGVHIDQSLEDRMRAGLA